MNWRESERVKGERMVNESRLSSLVVLVKCLKLLGTGYRTAGYIGDVDFLKM